MKKNGVFAGWGFMYIKYHCSCTSDRDKGILNTPDWSSLYTFSTYFRANLTRGQASARPQEIRT
ncbi:hypothetical protein AG1IA_07189 [Rhizoctonia solani AG-1 IA]|uniref:Uncharacterized protein n=1 Tax=Thanatephorus cucumeris (strain AG1-IA) TaxID=983506 RepID=L8WLI8_THACA|nr:hypothetical protein AG1IA_07189 [Rhizoctonia solani AG-1 IA]